ncbi:MAG: hypothetical protein ACRCY6_02345 [Bacteroidales bacterium]
MNAITRFWIVANFEVLVSIVVAITLIPSYTMFAVNIHNVEAIFFMIFFVVGAIFLPIILAIVPPAMKRSGLRVLIVGSAVYLLVLIILLCALIGGLPYEFSQVQWIINCVLLPLFMLTLLVALALSQIAYRHLEKVSTQRLLYANSKASVFNDPWRYAIDRFFNVSFSAFVGFCGIGLSFGLMYILNHCR